MTLSDPSEDFMMEQKEEDEDPATAWCCSLRSAQPLMPPTWTGTCGPVPEAQAGGITSSCRPGMIGTGGKLHFWSLVSSLLRPCSVDTRTRAPWAFQKRVPRAVWKPATPDCSSPLPASLGQGVDLGEAVAEVSEAGRCVGHPKMVGSKAIPEVSAGHSACPRGSQSQS